MEYYTLDRNAVAEKLDISTRTLDRHVAKNMFSTKKIKGKIFFHSKEVEDFYQQQNTESIDASSTTQSTRLHNIQHQFSQNFQTPQYTNLEENTLQSVSKSMAKEDYTQRFETEKKALEFELQAQMYKKMYETTHQLFQAQQQQLQQAYYQMGEFESKMQNTVPLLEAQSQQRVQLEELENIRQQTIALQQEKQQLTQTAFFEQQQAQQKLKSAKQAQVFYFITTLVSIIGFSFFFALQ